MLNQIDDTLEYEYILTLCKPNKEPVAELYSIDNFNYEANFPTTDEISFQVPLYTICQGKKDRNKLWDLVKGDYLVHMQKRYDQNIVDEKYFVIVKPKEIDSDGISKKEVLAYSLEHELNKKIIRGYNLPSRQLYSVTNQIDDNGFQIGVLNYISTLTSWSIGNIDADLLTKFRSFNISELTVLGFLITEVQRAYGCVFIFDTVDKKINARKIETLGQNKGLYISEENYIKSINKEIDHDEIVTRLYVYGKDNLTINSLNPSGVSFVEDFSYYKTPEYMSQGLINALDNYNSLLQTKQGEFNNYLNNISNLESQISAKELELFNLRAELSIIQDNIDTAIQNGNSLTSLNTQKTNKQTQINNKLAEINSLNNQILNIYSNISALRETIKKENNFTSAQLVELDFYVREQTWSDSNYETVEDLWNEIPDIFRKINQPPLQFEIDSVDFLSILEFQRDWKKLILGDIVNIEYNKFNFYVQVRLVGYKHNKEDNTLKLVFSNRDSIDDATLYINDLTRNAILTSTSVNMSKYKWDKSEENASQINQIINSALDTAKNAVLAGKNQDIVINERGIALTDTTNPNEQLRIINNVLAMTKDNWNTSSLAITPLGIVAERLLGKILLGNQLFIEDSKGELNINGNLMTIRDNSSPKKIRVQLGEYATGKYGLLLKNKVGTDTILSEDGITQTDTIQLADNVDASNGLKLRFYVDDEVLSVKKVKLAFSLEKFRAYSTGAASGGGSSITSQSAGSVSTSTDSGGGTTASTNVNDELELWSLGTGFVSDMMSLELSSPNTHAHRLDRHRHPHSHNVSVPSHSHQFWINGHSHWVDVPNHQHSIQYGIFESTTATDVKIFVNGTQRGGTYNTDQNNIDLTQWIQTSGWHTIELTSTRLGRINASLYIKSFVGM